MAARIHILDGGPQTTVQDLGRPQFQSLGVPPSGALDPASFRLANLILGNEEGAAALELRLAGPDFVVEETGTRLALAGTDASLCIQRAGSEAVEEWAAWRGIDVRPGDRVRVPALRDGATAYLAFAGGVAVPPVMGSRSTCVNAGFGGYHGRALRPGDRIGLGRTEKRGPPYALANIPGADRALLRIVPGPQADLFPPEAFNALTGQSFRISRGISRMGVRLDGPEIVRNGGAEEFVSDATAAGSIQVTGSGQAIVLLADRGTTGGYPKIATLISADLAVIGRALPGVEIRFTIVDVEEAELASAGAEEEFRARSAFILPVNEPWDGR